MKAFVRHFSRSTSMSVLSIEINYSGFLVKKAELQKGRKYPRN